jgi:hypothetical protein
MTTNTNAATTAAVTAPDEREAFEAWMSNNGEWPSAIERGADGGYKLMLASIQWGAWQARAALAATPAAPAAVAGAITATRSHADILESNKSDAHKAWAAFERLQSDAHEAGDQTLTSLLREFLMRSAQVGVYRPKSEPPVAAPAAQGDALDAARYRTWRDNMIADSGPVFHHIVAHALPAAVGKSRGPTAQEWDAAIDAARAQAKEGGAA